MSNKEEPLFKGTITIVRTIEGYEDGHFWEDEVTIEGIPKDEAINLLECELIDLDDAVSDAIYDMED